MLDFFKQKTDDITIRCEMCSSSKTIRKEDFDDLKKRKFISFRCTCGTRFHKRIIIKNFKEIDLISAIANADIEVLWYKIKFVLFFFGGAIKSEKIQFV